MSLRKQGTCQCCGVHFDPTICAQCQVAGCAANKKNDKCRLNTIALGTQKLSEHQLRMRVEELESQNKELLAEGQRLAKLLFEAEAKKVAA